MKIRIVDLMDHYYGEEAVKLDSSNGDSDCINSSSLKSAEKTSTAKKRWLVAACLICVLSVAAALILPIFARPAGEQNACQEPAEEAAEPCVLSSEKTDAVLTVSAEHIDDFETDTPYPVTFEEIGEETTFDFANSIFTYYDRTQSAYGYDGLVWQITMQPREDLHYITEEDQRFYEHCYPVNTHLLGYDEEHIYLLACLGMLFEEEHQYDSQNMASLQSYYEHMEYGITVLDDFIEQNGLQTLDDVVDWKEWYIREIMCPIEEYIGGGEGDAIAVTPTPEVDPTPTPTSTATAAPQTDSEALAPICKGFPTPDPENDLCGIGHSGQISLEDICGDSEISPEEIETALASASGMEWAEYETLLSAAMESGSYDKVLIYIDARPGYYVIQRSPDGTRIRAIRIHLMDDDPDAEGWLLYTEHVLQVLSDACTEEKSATGYKFSGGAVQLEHGPVDSGEYTELGGGAVGYVGVIGDLGDRILEFSFTFEN